jgi:hypothetical protein
MAVARADSGKFLRSCCPSKLRLAHELSVSLCLCGSLLTDEQGRDHKSLQKDELIHGKNNELERGHSCADHLL